LREFSSPSTYTLPRTGNLTDDVVHNGTEHADSVVFSIRDAQSWSDVTAGEFLAQVRAVAKGLVAAGIESGDRVGLLSKTRFEWTLLDYAIWFVGGVTVPIYETSSAEQVEWILTDSAARAVLVETAWHRSVVEEARAKVDSLQHVWCLDDGATDELTTLGRDLADERLEERRTAVTPDSHATIIYTSGTTGRPKGCTLSHGNFMFEVAVAVEELDALFREEDGATLLFLPLAHVFARVIQVAAVRVRVRLGHSADVRHLVADLEGFRPTFVLAVPRVFEKVFNTASQNAAADGRSRVFDKAVDTAIAYSRGLDTGRPRPLLRIRHSLFDRLVYARLRAALGGRCRYAVSGGAPLGERLGHFYRGIGVTVLEGYGLTETTAAVTVNQPDAIKIGTVGRPLAGTAVRIADDGELEVAGGQVYQGYWGNPEATAEVLGRDGWLKTGDLAEIDDEGFVRITGRKKEILVTAGGKNVAPSTLEDRMRAHALVDQCMVVGDGRPFIAALVTLDPDATAQWAERHAKSGSLQDLVDDEDLRAEIQSAVDDANKAVSQAESVRKFVILPDAWTEEGGQLTPSLKLRRAVVMNEARHAVEDLYTR
jgi:long-chain acyl-CoA synthetase